MMVMIKEGTVEYSRRFSDGAAQVTLNLLVEEDNPGAAIAWAHQVIDEWSAKRGEPLELKADQEVAAEVVPQVNPTPAATTSEPPAASVPPAGGPKTAFTGNPFAIGAGAAPAVNPTPLTTKVGAPSVGAVTSDAPTINAPTGTDGASTPSSSTNEETAPGADKAPVSSELTDNDLHAAAHLAVERKVPAVAIKKITAKYAKGSMSMTAIPQENRAKWLAEVKELKRP